MAAEAVENLLKWSVNTRMASYFQSLLATKNVVGIQRVIWLVAINLISCCRLIDTFKYCCYLVKHLEARREKKMQSITHGDEYSSTRGGVSVCAEEQPVLAGASPVDNGV